MDYKEIVDKVKDLKTWEEVRGKLTDRELVYLLINEKYGAIVDGDAYPITDILKIVGRKNYSIEHALRILDMAKDLISTIARFEF